MEPHLYNLSRRDGPSIFLAAPSAAPYTTPALTANLVCRVLFGLLANLVCLVPLRLLYRNGEFAATVFILNVEVQNLRTVVNALIWRNDHLESWWPGYGLCDVDAYIHNISIGLFSTCLLAIMRNLALQVGSLRANPLTQKEKRQRNLIQALIMFPLPIVMIAFTFPLASHRYFVGTLVGCTWTPYPAWPYLFFVLGPAVVSLITAVYAVLTYVRFREVAKATESALSSNRIASMRSQRTKRRLYLMVLSILTPFLPVVIALAVCNMLVTGPLESFDYGAIHSDDGPMPWNTIVFLPSTELHGIYLNNCYIPIASAVPIFLFFGMTKDAMNCYRVTLLYMGLGKVFPSLYEEYNPDRRALGSSSNGSSTFAANSRSRKNGNPFTSSNHLNINSINSSSANTSSHRFEAQPISFLSSIDCNAASTTALQRPPPSIPASHSPDDSPIQLPNPNPFLFRTRFNFPIPFRLSLFKSSKETTQSNTAPSLSLEPLNLPSQWSHAVTQPSASHQPARSTWTDEEESTLLNTSSTSPLPKSRPANNSGDMGIGIGIDQASLRQHGTTGSQTGGQQH